MNEKKLEVTGHVGTVNRLQNDMKWSERPLSFKKVYGLIFEAKLRTLESIRSLSKDCQLCLSLQIFLLGNFHNWSKNLKTKKTGPVTHRTFHCYHTSNRAAFRQRSVIRRSPTPEVLSESRTKTQKLGKSTERGLFVRKSSREDRTHVCFINFGLRGTVPPAVSAAS